MQLFSPFCGSYRCEDRARSNRNHGPGSLCRAAFPSNSSWLASSSFSRESTRCVGMTATATATSLAQEWAGNHFPISAWCLGDGPARLPGLRPWARGHPKGRRRLLDGSPAGSAQWSPRKNFRNGASYRYMASSDRKLCVLWHKRATKFAKRPHNCMVGLCGKCALREPTSLADPVPHPRLRWRSGFGRPGTTCKRSPNDARDDCHGGQDRSPLSDVAQVSHHHHSPRLLVPRRTTDLCSDRGFPVRASLSSTLHPPAGAGLRTLVYMRSKNSQIFRFIPTLSGTP